MEGQPEKRHNARNSRKSCLIGWLHSIKGNMSASAYIENVA